MVEGDNKSIVSKLNSTDQDISGIGSIIRSVKMLATNFVSCQFLFTGRSGNKPAHALASEGLRQFGDRFWIEDAPALILALAAQDRRFLDPP
ncbi:hypothetical protein GQ457_12G018660 [Hibiscus cannabinus]